jgi:hypothetical protein
MNERIKELAEQAMSATFNKFSGVEWSAEEWRNFYDTKFAELIVQECMEQVWYTREDGINGNVSEVIKDRIKQHFGVEE